MDCDEAADSYASTDSQARLVLEFNNQASLKNSDNFQTTNDNELSVTKLQVMGIENNWNEDESFLTPPSHDFPIPLPPPNGFDDISSCMADQDPTTFAGEIAALFSPTELQVDGVGDSFDMSAEAGVCGLRNLGNTCFMSTGVQCLMATPALVSCFLEQNNPIKDSLIAHLSSLTQKMWSGQYSAVQPTDFKEILGIHFPQFKDFRQHDCQEFLALLLDGLHEQMNLATNHLKTFDESKECAKMDLNAERETSTSYEQVDSRACNTQKLCSNNVYTKHINSVSNSKVIEKNDIGIHLSDTQSDENLLFEGVGNKSVHNNSICGNKLAVLSNKTKLNSFGDKDKEKSYPEGFLNNSTQRITGLEDISKDSKTSNVNVLVTEQEANNEIRFDSEKYPRNDNVRRRETLNLNAFQIYENNTASGKRGKSTVTHYNCPSDFREGLDLKRLKLHPRESSIGDAGSGDDEMDTLIECDQEKNQRMEEQRKHRLPDSSSLLEKNYRMECERKRRELAEESSSDAGPSSASVENCNLEPQAEEREEESRESTLSMELEAEKHWEKHLATHQSVIVDTFQGQFKSTVVCSGCKYISVTYEPFMYLSVPLPHAMERQICVTFIGGNNAVPMQYMLTVNKRDKVSYIKKQLLQLIGKPSLSVVLAEVLDNHIAKILDENYLIRYVDDTIRSVYAFEVVTFQSASCTESMPEEKIMEHNNDNVGNYLSDSDACTICLEEMDSNMNRHVGCSCVLCDSCIARSSQHYGEGTLICPVCRKKLTPGIDLVAVQLTPNTKSAVRMLNIPLVFRLDTFGDGNNNMKTVKLFGHPRLLRLPNHFKSQELHEVVSTLVPYPLPYKLLYVDGQGHHCSRCMFNSHCRGCLVPIEGSLMLHTGDTLAIMFSEPVEEIITLKHSTMNSLRTQHPLSLYDCIRAFSQSEVLDEHNPWYCPKCQQNQCATKTLSVWRYPSYLIVYLKRFVFHDCVSMKLEDKVMFPLCGLNLDSHSSLYDLYACVCHIGGVSAGHYTAYTQHPYTGEWHYFNDDYVTKQMPQEDDFSNAYILFYKMRGADVTNQSGNSSSRLGFPSHSHS